jgi:Ca-activated chloride channel family protein
MRAKDVPPDRISASQSAARAFVLALPADVRIGVVSYAGIAQVVQPPTTNKEAVIEAIGRFQLQRGTAIGNGIAMSLATLFPDDGIDVSQLDMPRPLPHGRPPVEDRAAPHAAPSVAPGSYRSAAIVLLTDGQSFMGFDPMAAAQMAADRGVRVLTVGVGTRDGEVLDLGGWKMRVKLDEDTLMRISNLTVGKYFHAGSESDLGEIYKELGGRLVYERERMEITVLLAALAGVLMLTAASLSLWWYGRIA